MTSKLVIRPSNALWYSSAISGPNCSRIRLIIRSPLQSVQSLPGLTPDFCQFLLQINRQGRERYDFICVKIIIVFRVQSHPFQCNPGGFLGWREFPLSCHDDTPSASSKMSEVGFPGFEGLSGLEPFNTKDTPTLYILPIR